jgi:hypothetical protein
MKGIGKAHFYVGPARTPNGTPLSSKQLQINTFRSLDLLNYSSYPSNYPGITLRFGLANPRSY